MYHFGKTRCSNVFSLEVAVTTVIYYLVAQEVEFGRFKYYANIFTLMNINLHNSCVRKIETI